MRTIVNATLAYGHVSAPVGIATAAKRKDSEFRTLHGDPACLSPIKTDKLCPKCDRALEAHELVKGYEFAKNQFVVVEEDELLQLAAERSKVVTIKKFVPWEDVDDLAVEKNYFLTPSAMPALAKPYATIQAAMMDAEVVAIASCALWGKEYPAMVWPRESGSLVISMLYCHDEIVDDSDISTSVQADGAKPSPDELEAAKQFIGMLIHPIDPQEDLRSHTRERIEEYLSAKVQGLDFEFAEPDEQLAPTIDFMEQLKRSIEGEKEKVTA